MSIRIYTQENANGFFVDAELLDVNMWASGNTKIEACGEKK